MVFPPSYLSTVEAHLIGSPDPAVGVVFPESKNSTNGWKTVATSAATPRPPASLAHATANRPTHERDKGLDADCGVKLDRRSHPTLGPDSPENDGPRIVEEVSDHLRPKVLAEHPKATLEITARAILIKFNAPLLTGEDPTVDLIVGLRRLAWFEVTPAQLLDRHVIGGWDVLRAEDVKENELPLQEGFRLLSSDPNMSAGGSPPHEDEDAHGDQGI